jgi:uncharacterized cupredoxin-like copper-binding protein
MESNSETKTSSYSKRPAWQWIALYAVIAVIVYSGVYYALIAKKGGYGSNTTAQKVQAAANISNSQQISVTGTEFSFDPSVITVKKGVPVEITFKNNGKYPHNLTIGDLSVATKTIQPGQQDTVTFTPAITGQFSFLCTVPGHADKGMTGTLNVQ